MWVLIIILLAGSDGGRAVNTDLKFTNRDACEIAADKVRKNTNTGWYPLTTCVEIK